MPAEITPDVPVALRSRTFSTDQAAQVLALLKGETEGQGATFDDDGNVTEAGTPARNVGFGSFDTAGAARSAGVTLNRLLRGLGAEHNYAVTTQERDGKHHGVILNKPAKVRTTSDNGNESGDETETPAPRRRRRQS